MQPALERAKFQSRHWRVAFLHEIFHGCLLRVQSEEVGLGYSSRGLYRPTLTSVYTVVEL